MTTDLSIKASQFVSTEVEEILNLVFLGNTNWKWLTLITTFLFLLIFRKFLRWSILKIKKNKKHFQENTFMSFFLEQEIEKGISWAIISIMALIVVDTLSMTTGIDRYLTVSIKLFLSLNLIRTGYLAAAALGQNINQWALQTESDLDDQLAPFLSKILKVLVVVVGILILLQNLGVDVTALMAGLGIGGVALAFAAQDTVANVFGTITILLDRPFKLGDWVKVGETEGVVEELGFRSTRIRTFYNSLITVPNSAMAKERIDNLSARNGWIRFRHTIGFTYDAKPDVIQQFCENLRYELLQDASVDRNRIVTTFYNYGDSSLNILVQLHYKIGPNDIEALKASQFLELIHSTAEKHQLKFAFPTRTLVIEGKPNTIV